jgi:hypothetical protein
MVAAKTAESRSGTGGSGLESFPPPSQSHPAWLREPMGMGLAGRKYSVTATALPQKITDVLLKELRKKTFFAKFRGNSILNWKIG